jgi:hypothetical protein
MQFPCCGQSGIGNFVGGKMDNGLLILAILIVLGTLAMAYILWPRRSPYDKLPRTHLRNGQVWRE